MKKCFNNNDIEAFLSLVRLGINHTAYPILQDYNWTDIQALANEQGLSAVVLDGVEKLPDDKRPPKDFTLQWIGEVLQSYEHRYELYRRAISEMAGFFNEHGLKMMVLKGYACSLNWPKPEHRPCGDIDIWLFGQQKEGDSFLQSEKHIKVDKSHHHHTVFYWRDFMVENHYDFINTHRNKPNAEQEVIFKDLGADDTHRVNVYEEAVYIPSPNLHAFFLTRHLMGHFASSIISLRQVMDWAFFVECHSKEIDWKWLLGILDKYHMMDFFNLINAICVDDLGFRAEVFPIVQFLPELKERVLADILEPAYGTAEPERFFSRIAYKYRRWQGNAWKQKLCYSESRWESFWMGIWNHVLKPSSI